jgi:hypothetical protein
LNHHVTPFNHLAGPEIADPIVRQIGAREHEVARAKLADIGADELAPVRAGDEVNFIFGVIIPASDVARTIVLMPLERLRRIGDNRFEIRRSAMPFLRAMSYPLSSSRERATGFLVEDVKVSSENVIRT